MLKYNIKQAQNDYTSEITTLKNNGIEPRETQQAAVFAKILEKQSICSDVNVTFCSDNELFISKTITGYDVVGYYFVDSGMKHPFCVTVCKIDDLWYPSRRDVAADTKSCSGAIFLWILLFLGCTLMGILMFYLMSAAIGI